MILPAPHRYFAQTAVPPARTIRRHENSSGDMLLNSQHQPSARSRRPWTELSYMSP